MKLIFLSALLLGAMVPEGTALIRRAYRQQMTHAKRVPAPGMMVDLLSIAAGSVAGAVGVGFAYPFDSMKTKIQNIAALGKQDNIDEHVPSFLQTAHLIFKNEGLSSLYKGVAGVMIGSGLIKACAFSMNRWALSELTTGSPTLDQLCFSAAFAGMVTSFFSNPIERVKVLMQSENGPSSMGEEFSGEMSEVQVLYQVLELDGFYGLAFRGLDATLAREIPGYLLYFVGYFTLIHGPLGVGLGAAGPLVVGALAGMLSWFIVFPLDVCKTNLQNTMCAAPSAVSSDENSAEDSDPLPKKTPDRNLLTTAVMLRERHGMGVFVKGMTPKMMQAGVSHSVTFYVYDLILRTFSP